MLHTIFYIVFLMVLLFSTLFYQKGMLSEEASVCSKRKI